MIGKQLHVLGIESSCDDSGVAIIRSDGKVLSNCVHSQLKQHLSLGGIIPMVAKEYHLDNIDRVANQAFKESGCNSVAKDIDAIAVTNRPGLNHSLQVGLNYARTLAKKYNKPLIPIHHMQAHALIPLLHNRAIRFPFIAFLISGGHCLLSICEQYNKFHLLGSANDEAPGECLDKMARRARLRDLGPPFDSISGGAAIELLSRRPGTNRFKYFYTEQSVPALKVKSCDLSFSGYRSAFDSMMPSIDELWSAGHQEKLLDELGHIFGSLQRVILVQLFKRLQRAMMYYRMYWRFENPNSFESDPRLEEALGFNTRRTDDLDNSYLDIVVSGGVAANEYLVEGLRKGCTIDLDPSVKLYAPAKGLSSDNGLMIAWNGMLRYLDHLNSSKRGEDDVRCDDLNMSVIYDHKLMDNVESYADWPIGNDLTQDVKMRRFTIETLANPELKVKPTNWSDQQM